MSKKNIADIYPLSPTQQGILLQTLYDQGSGIHVEQLVCQVHGVLDRPAFEQAWRMVLDRHAVLRTSFVWKNAPEPFQVVSKHVEPPLEFADWQDTTSQEQAGKLDAYLSSDRQRGFELTKPPLMRLALFQLGPDHYQLVWSHNHILMDGWCGPVLLREFLAYYQAYLLGQTLVLPGERPYRDYIQWLHGQDPSHGESFWRGNLHGLAGPTPVGKLTEPRPESEQVERYGKHSASLSKQATTALKSFARSHHLTVNTLVQGAWALLLARYSGNNDIVFGTTVSGRPPDLPGIEGTIGLFINTLPIRVNLTPNEKLWSWLAKLQDNNFELQPYESTSASLIHRWSGLPGTLSLYESLLVFENYPLDTPEFGSAGLSVDLTTAHSEGARTGFAVTILVMDGAQLQVQLVHDLRRLNSEDCAHILAHFLFSLEAIAAEEEHELSRHLERIRESEIPHFRPLLARERQVNRLDYVAPRTETEARLAALWAEILGIERVGIYDNFFELGGHSLLAIQLYYRVREVYPMELSLMSLFTEPNVARLAQAIDSARPGNDGESLTESPAIDLETEAVLDPAINLQGMSYQPATRPACILLTGATGFLGAYLLRELLDQTQAEIFCLVRAADSDEGLLRLKRALQLHHLWDDAYEDRLIPVVGDLVRPRLGLSPSEFQELAEKIDVIYHNGAWVTYVFPYASLKPANVLGTQEVLRLSCQSKLKAVHYVSSMAVFPLENGTSSRSVNEAANPDDWKALFGGYAQSKWVGERLATLAQNRNLPVTIYRPGLVTGHSQTGDCDTDNMMSLLVKGFIQLGSVPEIATRIDMTPVDFVSKAIVYLSLLPDSTNQIYHLTNPNGAHWDEVAQWIRGYGFPLRLLPYKLWQDEISELGKRILDNALYPLLPLLGERNPEGQPILASLRMPNYSCQDTLARLEGSGLTCPELDESLMQTYLDYFVNTGYLQPE